MPAGTEVERLIVRLTGDATQYQKTLAVSTKQTEQFARSVERSMRSVGRSFNDAGKAASQFGRSMSLRVSLPLLAIGAAAIKAGADFDSGFAGVRKTVSATEEELSVLRSGFKDLASEIPISIRELLAIGETAGQLEIGRASCRERV